MGLSTLSLQSLRLYGQVECRELGSVYSTGSDRVDEKRDCFRLLLDGLGHRSAPTSDALRTCADRQTFLQGGIDGQGVVTMRANQTWSGSDITKIQGQVCNGPLVIDRGQD